MSTLPLVCDIKEAITFYKSNSALNDAQRAYIVGFLAKQGFSNKMIREALGISQIYAVTHLKRAGTLLSEEELSLWCRNPHRISLGHIRAIAKLPQKERDGLLRDLLAKKRSVHEYEKIAQGKSDDTDVDIKQLERNLSEQLGRPVGLKFNPSQGTGTIQLSFFSLDDLDVILKSIGYSAETGY